MIFGAIDPGMGQSPPEETLLMMTKTLSWDGCVAHPVHWQGFNGMVLLNPALPYDFDDHVYIDEDAGISVFMDGCVYNREAVQKALNTENAGMTTPGLICRAFHQWGPQFAQQLNGDFAICIYQPREKQVFLIRDHLGIRPLAYAQKERVLYFSTDGMGLCKALYPDEKINPQYLLNQFLWGGYDQNLMPHMGVQKVKPGHFLQTTENTQETIRYWHPEKSRQDNKLKPETAYQHMKTLVREAIKIRCDHRFRASAHMSGALDSGVVSVLVRKEYLDQHPFYALSWTPRRAPMEDHLPYDERKLIIKACEQNNMIPFFADFGPEDCLTFTGEWRSTCHYLAERKVVEFVQAKNINLIFSGWGGDEFVSIGNRGIDADLIRDFRFRAFLRKYPLQKPRKVASALLFQVLFPGLKRPYVRQKTDPAIYPYIQKTIGSNIMPFRKRFSNSSRRRVHLQLLDMNHLDQRTSDWYVYGQRQGVEYRYPLLDKRIIEYILTIPSHCLVSESGHHRILLRNLAREVLPPEIAENKSKEDPVANAWQMKLAGEALEHLKASVKQYRHNPDLDFVDWDLLEKKLPDMQPPGNHSRPENDPAILPYVKAAHEFTVGYYMDEDGRTKK